MVQLGQHGRSSITRGWPNSAEEKIQVLILGDLLSGRRGAPRCICFAAIGIRGHDQHHPGMPNLGDVGGGLGFRITEPDANRLWAYGYSCLFLPRKGPETEARAD